MEEEVKTLFKEVEESIKFIFTSARHMREWSNGEIHEHTAEFDAEFDRFKNEYNQNKNNNDKAEDYQQ